jgi:GT2 family glycosyltransferase
LVSVVVPTCGDAAAVERCVRSILASNYDRLEVIVVENRPRGSVTSRMLTERFAEEPRLHYIEERRPGASRARNAGLAEADGEVVAFADDDVVVDRDWIRRAVEAFERGDDIACVTGLILPLELETETQVRLEQFMTLGKGFSRQVYRLPEARIEHPLLPYTPGLIGSGANTVLRADVIRLLGGFDPTLGPATPAVGGEDLDMYIRLLQQGHAVAYEPSAIVWHEHPDSAELLHRQVYRYGIGLGATLTKQLVVGPDRRGLLSAVPAGIRYARDPESRKNAGKSADFPRRLDWLERLGMALGPAAYVASALLGIPRRAASPLGVTSVDGQTLYVGQLTLPSGDAVRVVEVAPTTVPRPATSHIHTRAAASPTDRAATAVALGACVAAPIAVALGLPTGLRFAAVLALFCLAPGTALMWALRGRAELALTVGVSLGVTVVLAQSMLWLGFWHPQLYLYGLAGICFPPLVSRVRLSRRGPAGMAFRRAREVVTNAPHATLGHLTLLAAAVALWGASLTGAHLSRMAGIGLLDAMPSSFFIAFALIVVGFAVAASADEADTRLLALYLLALILVLQGTTAILYDEPRYPSLYKHLGVINLISATHAVERDIDVYNNWPALRRMHG